jgi:hypothetical protein
MQYAVSRLSVLAGHKLTDGNPEIADLSDPFRPTNIAEQFRQLYDDEWTCALEELGVSFEREEEIIDFLACIIKVCVRHNMLINIVSCILSLGIKI